MDVLDAVTTAQLKCKIKN